MPDIPGLYRYECLEGDDSDDYIEEIRPSVTVNFSGTIYTKNPIDEIFAISPDRFPGFTDENPSDGFIGLALSPEEFLAMTEDELEYFDKKGEKKA